MVFDGCVFPMGGAATFDLPHLTGGCPSAVSHFPWALSPRGVTKGWGECGKQQAGSYPGRGGAWRSSRDSGWEGGRGRWSVGGRARCLR